MRIAYTDDQVALRSELREWVSRGDLAAETVNVLRSGLDEVRAAVVDSLRKTNS